MTPYSLEMLTAQAVSDPHLHPASAIRVVCLSLLHLLTTSTYPLSTMVRASQAFGLPALASIAASGSGGRGSDDDDHWGTGGSGAGDSDDDEDSEDDEQNEWALGFGSDDQGAPISGRKLEH